MAGKVEPVVTETYVSREHPGLDAIARTFRSVHGQALAGACFGVAGPVIDGHVETPNLAWDVDAAGLARTLALPQVGVINDLEANAHGIFTLEPADFVVLNQGALRGNQEHRGDLRGHGTRRGGDVLGRRAASSVRDCEGGHADFAPHSDVELESRCATSACKLRAAT